MKSSTSTRLHHSAPRLSDTALVLLGHAANREDLMLLPPPTSVKARGKALEAVLKKLLDHSLIEEIWVRMPEQAWRSDEQDRLGLRITSAGLAAIGVPALESGMAKGAESAGHATAAGSTQLEIGVIEGTGEGGERSPQDQSKVAGRRRKSSKRIPQKAASCDKPARKADRIVALLERPVGASVAEMCVAAGWQAHSVRGFLSGTVKKKMGLAVTSEVTAEGERRYRISNMVAS